MIQSTIRFDRERESLKHDLNSIFPALQLTSKASYRFRTLEEAKLLALLLGYLCPEPDHTCFGLYELLLNAVEHGNLEISYATKTRCLMDNRWLEEVALRLTDPRYKDRMVCVDIEQQPKGFSVIITDQGNGFQFEPYLDFAPERLFDLHGKGIAMANKVYLDKLEYLGNGNQVKVFIPATR